MKKLKIKDKKKAKIIALLSTIGFLIIGTSAFLIGGTLAGWNIWSWFSTPQALFIFALIGIAILLLAGIVMKMILYKDGE